MTATDIANLALAKLGDHRIITITDPNDKNARLAKLHYAQAVDEALRAHFWGFAMATVSLTKETVTTPAMIVPWSAAFALPTDFIKLRAVRNSMYGKVDRFDLRRVNSKRCLVCNQTDAVLLDYVARVDDTNQFDPLFTAALVTLLASKLARAITGSDQAETTFRQTYLSEDLPAARLADGHDTQSAENHPLQDILDGALTGRRSNFLHDFDR